MALVPVDTEEKVDMATEIITDRDLATQTSNYNLWKPRNMGPADSWGVLLNENAEALDLIFADIYSQILIVSQANSLLEAAVGTLDTRIGAAEQDITALDSSLGATITSLGVVQSEIANARGVYANLDGRFNAVVDASGNINLDNIFQDVRTVKWNNASIAISGVKSEIVVAGVFPAKPQSSDGQSFGIRTNTDCRIISADFTPVYDAAGFVVAGQTSKVGNDLVATLVRSSTGVPTSINVSGEYQHATIQVIYPEIVRESDDDTISGFSGAVKLPDMATSARPGFVRLGSGNGNDADMLDGFHSNSIPQANNILPLDASGQFPATVIRIDDNSILKTLQVLQTKLLRTEGADTYKGIEYYIGNVGSRKFPLTKSGDEGSQFSKTVTNIEFMLDDHESRLDAIEPLQIQDALNIASVSGEVDVLQAQMAAHLPDPNAHHSETSNGIAITPSSVTTPLVIATSGDFQHLDVQTLQVHVATYVQDQMYIKDRFTDINKASGDGPYGSEEVPVGDDYQTGFVMHKGSTYVSGEYGLLRYNKTREQIEFASSWKPELAGLGILEQNQFVAVTGAAATAIVGAKGSGKYGTIAQALAALSPNGGKIIVHAGVYVESFVLPGHVILEGMGYDTHVSGDITLSGDYNVLRDIRTNGTLVEVSGVFNKIKDCFLLSDTVDNGISTVLVDNIIL